ncbi:MAG: hypothetical protein CVV14_01995 [Gammaproteobacteria bacterium HGW-Gammaproteobacteria-4]|nr:MAG: hypothetical protein CVV14_01995 [Gammaproteobacteria bacterium HGW-Gammaproteobacteria-4]
MAYAVTVLICVWLLKHPLTDAPPVWRALVALLPMAPIAWMIRVQVAMIMARDELQRRIDLEAIAIASIGVGLGSLSLALLIVARVWDISGRVALLWVLPALSLCYGVARYWVARRYR